jgi:hypothetical protein
MCDFIQAAKTAHLAGKVELDGFDTDVGGAWCHDCETECSKDKTSQLRRALKEVQLSRVFVRCNESNGVLKETVRRGRGVQQYEQKKTKEAEPGQRVQYKSGLIAA